MTAAGAARSRSTSRRRATTTAALAAVVVLLAACSGGSAPEPEATDPSPLDSLMAEHFTWTEMYEASDAVWEERERIIAECMRESGFEYFLTADVSEAPEPEPTGPIPEDRLEFVQLYGYGQFVDGPYPRDATQLVQPDLNGEYQESLSPEAQSAYRAAFWGTNPVWEGDGTNDVPLSEQGCSGRAEEWASTRDTLQSPAWTWIQDAMNTLDEAALRDARVTEVVLAFSTCMAQAGFPEVTVGWEEDSAFAYLQAQYSELMSGGGKARVADLEELGQLEIELAVAEELCMRSTGSHEIRRAVRAEYEQEFITAHRAELEAHLAAVAELVGD